MNIIRIDYCIGGISETRYLFVVILEIQSKD